VYLLGSDVRENERLWELKREEAEGYPKSNQVGGGGEVEEEAVGWWVDFKRFNLQVLDCTSHQQRDRSTIRAQLTNTVFISHKSLTKPPIIITIHLLDFLYISN
jgi:hypothetical protein